MKKDAGKGFLVVAVLALCMGALASILWVGRLEASKQEERDDLDLFLDAASAGWAEVTEQFFLVPETAAQTIGALESRVDDDERLALLVEVIRETRALDAAYVGYADGSFVFAGRSDEEAVGGFRTRSIAIEDGERTVTLTWTDSALNILRSETDESDQFDPRARPWYGPVAADEISRFWTAPYIFDSSKQPGITHSAVIQDATGELIGVVGIDIRLAQLSEFLDELRPGSNGAALVVSRDAELIASSSMDGADIAELEDGTLDVPIGAELSALLDDLRENDVESVRARTEDRMHTVVLRPAGVRDDWYLGVQALDGDFHTTDSAATVFEVAAVGLAVAAMVGGLGYLAMRYLRRLRRQADRDELTGVLNRRAIKRRIGLMMDQQNANVFVAIIDLDLFKKVNDQHGHFVGDAVLVEMANRIEAFAASNQATAGRLGGDEFIVFADHELPWQGLCDALARPANINDLSFELTASIGVAVTSGSEVDLAALLADADHALFEAKRAGGGHHQRYADQTSRSTS